MKNARFALMIALAIAMAALGTAQKVTTSSLLNEMTDLTRLASSAGPSYTTSQASSYDRESTREGIDSWFANGDYGKYVGKIEVGGRTEWVLAQLSGPGTVVRIWSANPTGVLRFYFDGEKEPRLTAKTLDLLTGKVKPYVEPYAYMAARGCNLYFPFPYAKSLVITVEDTNKNANGMYYHVNYRTYQKGTTVETFRPDGIPSLASSLAPAPLRFGAENPFTVSKPLAKSWAIAQGPGMITGLKFKLNFPVTIREADWNDPIQKHNILRSLELQMQFDGETCVRIPLADLFAAGTQAKAFDTLPVSIHGNEFTIRWPMPYKQQATIILVNYGDYPVTGSLSYAHQRLPNFGDRMYFHAQWGYDYKGTRPMTDMVFLNTRGEGRFVGCTLTVGNPVRAWWGEGDEKVNVDGEEFPSTFGTGTEDYFGYAWCCNEVFQQAYHAQPQCDGPANFGYAVNARYHIFDDIPFKKSMKFAIEKWHWANTNAHYSYASFWYAKPGSKGPVEIDPEALPFMQVSLKYAPVGSLEGETLKFEANGGKAIIQEGIGGASDEKQIWWMDAKVGDRLTVNIPSASAGKFSVIMNACMATDYGAHRFFLNGVEIGVMDFYSPDLLWKEFNLGEFDLKAGDNQLVIEHLGSNPGSKPKRAMFGLDWVLLKPAVKK